MKINWLASYPKSGNTWVRFLLYHYFYGAMGSTAELAERIPDSQHAHLVRPAPGGAPPLVKTHWALTPTMPFADRTAGAIYIVRRPKDVLLSLLDFYHMRDPQRPWTDEQFVRNFIAQGGDPSLAARGFGSLVQNVTTWTAQRRFPLLLVRYEDLKADSARELRRMVEFLGRPVDEGRARQAAEASSFERMREAEARAKATPRPGAPGPGAAPPDDPVFEGGTAADLARGHAFMAKGRTNQTLAPINPALDREFDERFRVTSWLLGYG
ncbi:MAG: sulfotransferase domain-containing protein [Phycisphaerales bacterium]